MVLTVFAKEIVEYVEEEVDPSEVELGEIVVVKPGEKIPIDGIIIVTTPQDLVSMVVKKSINMAKMMYINTLGIVENMAYIKCPKCDEKIRIFGSEESKKEIEKSGIKVISELPIDPVLSQLVDKGEIEEYETEALNPLIEIFEHAK